MRWWSFDCRGYCRRRDNGGSGGENAPRICIFRDTSGRVVGVSVGLQVDRRDRNDLLFPFFQVFKLKNISSDNPQLAETQRITQNQTFQINCVSLNFCLTNAFSQLELPERQQTQREKVSHTLQPLEQLYRAGICSQPIPCRLCLPWGKISQCKGIMSQPL